MYVIGWNLAEIPVYCVRREARGEHSNPGSTPHLEFHALQNHLPCDTVPLLYMMVYTG